MPSLTKIDFACQEIGVHTASVERARANALLSILTMYMKEGNYVLNSVLARSFAPRSNNNTNICNAISGRRNCELPKSWSGDWFEYGERDKIQIDTKNVTHKGNCITKQGDKYIFRDP